MLNTRFSFFGQCAGHNVGVDQIDIDAPENGTNVPHDALALEAAMTRPGYIYYLSNETKYSEVYFDDLLITHTHSPIVQKDDYYPFGLGIAGLSAKKENSPGNRWTFQGQERQDAHDLGWYGFKWRNHQPELGRFFNIDPLSEKYTYNSTFAFSENRVVDGIELEGLEFFGTSSNFLSGVSNWYQTQQLNATIYNGWFNYGVASIWNSIDNNFNMARPMAEVMLHSKELADFELAYKNGETYHQFLPNDGFVNLRQLSYLNEKFNLQANVIGDIGNMAKVQGNWFGVLSGAHQSVLSPSFTGNIAMNRWMMSGKNAFNSSEGGLNIFKFGASQTELNTGWKTGDYFLHLPYKGTPKLDWKANYGALRREISFGKPIFDSYRGNSGLRLPARIWDPNLGKYTGQFLNAESYVFESRGWIYYESIGAYFPPHF